MNIHFQILWFDDKPKWYDRASKKVAKFIEEHNYLPEFNYKKDDDYDDLNISPENCDLILIDYDLGKGITGNSIIDSIREKNIMTDIIFYSADCASMKASFQENQDDEDTITLVNGVYFTERANEQFHETVQQIIKKNIKLSERVVNVRGLVMDATSRFDSKMIAIITMALEKFNDEEKERISKKTINTLKASLEGHSRRIERICGECAPWDCIVNERKFYLPDSNGKVRIISLIIKILKNNYNIYEEKYSGIAMNYKEDVLKVRNDLAHVEYDSEKNALVNTIDKSDYILNDEEKKKIRSDLIFYRSLFIEIENKLNEIKV